MARQRLCRTALADGEPKVREAKYEEVYLRAHGRVSEARASIGRYLGFYNGTRPHSSLGGRTPDQAYLNQPTPIPEAA
jgi:putative transposase